MFATLSFPVQFRLLTRIGRLTGVISSAHAAICVDKILEGFIPPISPSSNRRRFELAINVKTGTRADDSPTIAGACGPRHSSPRDAGSPPGSFAQPGTFFRGPGPPAGSRSPAASCPAAARARESWCRPRAGGWRGQNLHWPGLPSSPGLGEALPAADHAGRDVELAAELSDRLLAGQNPLDRCPLELRVEHSPPVRLPWNRAHGALPSCRRRIAPSVSSAIEE